ncbi:MAG: transcription termination factor NusA [Patescibacteria group bacterium]|nr:transcription termination factor NusA [Patescibacteria group bacterium]MDD4304666.1 transcription termination factor NusA [Patescibacteria group bacterium]MDD4695693.1 transcription termination factor NusA [Patescibacteria group bacterium]
MFSNIEEIKQAIQNICDEKNISIESVLESIEAALAAAYRKDFGNKNQNVKISFDINTGDISVYDIKTVVEDKDLEKEAEEYLEIREKIGEDEPMPEDFHRFNPKTEIMISEAKTIQKKAKIDDEIKITLETPTDFGRIAAQTAKQVIIQRIREAERTTIFNEFKGREGEVVNTIIQRREGSNVVVDLNKVLGVIPPEEQVRTDNYMPGSRLRVLILKVEETNKGPKIVVSRAHPEVINKIFTLEVPEIANGIVQIESIARDAGSRTKIAVSSNQTNIDPIGSCVGQKGSRVQTIINELGGEKIDIIEWSKDPSTFIKNALSPAKIINLELNKEEQSAIVKVEEDQLSLAIGRDGQNVKLASKLTGWKIDIEGTEDFTKEEPKIKENKSEKPEEEVSETEE